MSNQKKKNSNYASLGSLIFAAEFDEEGNRLEGQFKTDEDGKKVYRLKLDKDTKISINGVDFTGKTLYVNRPVEKFKRMLAKGTITQKEFEQKVADFAPGGKLEFVQLEITAKLD